MPHQVNASASDLETWENAAISALLSGVARRLEDMPQRPSADMQDSVTGLMTRAALHDHGARLFASALRNKAPVSVVLVDIDGLALINRDFGAAAGDAVLAHVGRLMAINIQHGVDLAGRHAGAVLMMVLPEADAAWASTFAERLRGSLANRPLTFERHIIEASACFGLACISERDGSFAALVKRAEEALADAKAAGPNLTLAA